MSTVLAVVNRSNQRGGRMLSVVDLVEAGTFSVGQAAWLLSRVRAGSSWLVGASPGGSGKTTVMSALLAMLPRDSRVWLSNRGSGWRDCGPGDTIVAYELSPGFYDAYIWAEDVRRLTGLGRQGSRIVSNLHADTLEQAREQIVDQCGASEEGFRAFRIFVPLILDRRSDQPGLQRYTPMVDGIHYLEDGSWRLLGRPELDNLRCPDTRSSDAPDSQRAGPAGIAAFLQGCLSEGVRPVEEVRARWLDWCDMN